MRRIRAVVLPAVAAVLLTACAVPAGSTEEPAGPLWPAAGSGGDPLALIGLWTVTEAEEEKGAILRLAAGELTLFSGCGYLIGNWRATPDGLFVGHTFGGDCGSDAAAIDTPPWLRRVSGFRPDGAAQLLLDDQGQTVARLVPGARPTPGPNLAPEAAAPPVVDEEARRVLAPASPLPSNLRPAARRDLLARWVPLDRSRWNVTRGPYAEIKADGEWQGSDGCNGSSGRWVSGSAGSLLATAGVSTLIGCDGVPVPSWLGQTYRAGFDDDVLVLLDRAGTELGRLRRG